MATVRRRLLRSAKAANALSTSAHDAQLVKLRARIARERTILARWLTRLKRAFHAMERQQRTIAGLERRLARHEQS